MAFASRAISIICTLLFLLCVSSAQSCSTYKFPKNKVFHSCNDLPFLGAHLHWSYSAHEETVKVAFRAIQIPTGWIAWGINPTGQGMVGTQAIVAFQDSKGNMTAYTTPITSYGASMQPGYLSFGVSSLSAEYVNNEMIIYAALGPLPDATNFNHVWQAGSTVSGDIPQVHETSGPNMQSKGKVDFLRG